MNLLYNTLFVFRIKKKLIKNIKKIKRQAKGGREPTHSREPPREPLAVRQPLENCPCLTPFRSPLFSLASQPLALTCKPFCVWGDEEFWKIECSSYPINFRCGMRVWHWKQITLVGTAIFSITESIKRCDGCKSKNLSCFNSNWMSDITLVGTEIF